VRRIDPASWTPQPWKNGGGITYELARWPAEGVYNVRVSLAEDERDSVFSLFPGYRRWSFLAGDAPIELAIGDATHRLVALGDHIEVPGDAAITSHLPAGPTRLFNILARVPIRVGHAATTHPVRFAIMLVATAELPRWTALIDAPAAPAGAVWLDWS
jgi:environmental stress-induced protein Ves